MTSQVKSTWLLALTTTWAALNFLHLRKNYLQIKFNLWRKHFSIISMLYHLYADFIGEVWEASPVTHTTHAIFKNKTTKKGMNHYIFSRTHVIFVKHFTFSQLRKILWLSVPELFVEPESCSTWHLWFPLCTSSVIIWKHFIKATCSINAKTSLTEKTLANWCNNKKKKTQTKKHRNNCMLT